MSYNKVIFVCNFAANYGGNFLASLYALACKLKAQKKNVVFIFPLAAQNKQWEIDLSQFNVAYCNFAIKALAHTIRSNISSSDRVVLHLHFITSLALLLDLKHYMKGRGIFVIQEHMIIGSNLKQRIKGFLLRTIGPKNAIFVGVSPAVYQQLCQRIGEKRTRLVINAIDTSRLDPLKNHHNSNILMFGTFFEIKGADLAIAALLHSKLASTVRLNIVSNDVTNTHNKIIERFGSIPSFVEVLPASTDARHFYNNCFLFLSPSRSEAFGYAVVEAAYSGDQVIASDILGQNTLKDIPGIVWIRPDNVHQLQNAIENIYASRTQQKLAITAKTQQYIRQHYSLDQWVSNILSVYDWK